VEAVLDLRSDGSVRTSSSATGADFGTQERDDMWTLDRVVAADKAEVYLTEDGVQAVRLKA